MIVFMSCALLLVAVLYGGWKIDQLLKAQEYTGDRLWALEQSHQRMERAFNKTQEKAVKPKR